MSADAGEQSSSARVFTIGHSTRPLDDFVALLRLNQVRLVVDVRTIPRSRRNPQYNMDVLPASLGLDGTAYRHMPGLGGLRHGDKNSTINAAWRNASFRGYADYMQTDEFERSLEELTDLAKTNPTAVMCAEAVPWRCHRSLIADAMLVRGFNVSHIIDSKEVQSHKLTPWARVEGTRITYPSIV